jgi:hypothetical protein
MPLYALDRIIGGAGASAAFDGAGAMAIQLGASQKLRILGGPFVLSNDESFQARNAADSSDISIFKLSSSDIVQLRGSRVQILDSGHVGLNIDPSTTARFYVNQGTITTDINAIRADTTWNDSGVTFTALELSVTSTASAAGSMLFDGRVGGASVLAILKDGKINFGGPTQTTVGAAGGASGLPATPTGYLRMQIAGTERVIPFYAQA